MANKAKVDGFVVPTPAVICIVHFQAMFKIMFVPSTKNDTINLHSIISHLISKIIIYAHCQYMNRPTYLLRLGCGGSGVRGHPPFHSHHHRPTFVVGEGQLLRSGEGRWSGPPPSRIIIGLSFYLLQVINMRLKVGA